MTLQNIRSHALAALKRLSKLKLYRGYTAGEGESLQLSLMNAVIWLSSCLVSAWNAQVMAMADWITNE